MIGWDVFLIDRAKWSISQDACTDNDISYSFIFLFSEPTLTGVMVKRSKSDLRQCVKEEEVAVLCSSSLTVRHGLCGRKATLISNTRSKGDI